MASSDDDELAELRAARAARSGVAGMSLATLRAQQRQAEAARAARQELSASAASHNGVDDEQDGRHDTLRHPPVGDLTDDVNVTEEDLSKFNLPLSFGGKQKTTSDKKALDAVHEQTKRASFGPPRPPGKGASITIAKPSSIPETQMSDGNPSQAVANNTLQGQHAHEAGVGPTKAAEEASDEPDVGPDRPPATSDNDDEGADASGPDQDEVEFLENDPYQLPISHEVVMGSAHAKGVTCIDIDHTGSRMITGSMDYTMRIYDFNGMKRDMKAFREFEAQEGHPVLSASWSPSGDAFLVVTGSAQAKIYDRDARSLGEFVRGDMYIRDMKNTKGHISGLMAGCWHPTDKFTAMTCSDDGTVRIWDTHNIMQKTVIKPTLSKPGRVAVTTCTYGQEGKLVAGGLMDGSIQVWSVSGKFGTSAAVGQVLPPTPQMVEKQNWSYVSRGNQVVRDAHAAQTEITSLKFSQDGHTLLSRAMDNTLKIWDLRKFKQPVHVWSDLPCAYATTNVIFSPDEQLILTCVSNPPSAAGNEGGSVVIFDKSKQEIIRKVGMPSAATTVAWHHRLNQIFVGIGDRKAGGTRALYDPERSQRGVLVGAARAPRKPSPFDLTPEQIARMVYEQPLYKRERMTGKKRREQMAHDAVKYHKPDPGMAAGMGKQGRIGTTQKTLLTQHLMKQRGGLTAPEIEMDPREAILRHADKKDVFSRLTDAYKATQPVPVFAQEDQEEDEEQDS